MISGIDGANPSVNSFIAAAAGAPSARDAGFQQAEQTGEVGESREIGAGKSELSEEEKREVDELEQRDGEVRRHEQAHKSAAGRYAGGGPSFEYEVGPDGRRYAVGGEVSIDVSPVADDPQATIQKMQQIRQAANAPAQPSDQDRRIAAEAAQLEQQARAELAAQKTEDQDEKSAIDSAPTIESANDSTPDQSIMPDSAIAAAFEQATASAGASATGKFIDTFA